MLLLPLTTTMAFLAIYFLGPERIYDKIYMYLVYSLLFMWSRNMILIQVCSVAKQEYHVFNRGTNWFLLSTFGFVLISRFYNFSPEKYFTYAFVFQFFLFAEFIYSSFNQVADILKIKIFKIPYDPKGDKKN